jgi:hypothetical protein
MDAMAGHPLNESFNFRWIPRCQPGALIGFMFVSFFTFFSTGIIWTRLIRVLQLIATTMWIEVILSSTH